MNRFMVFRAARIAAALGVWVWCGCGGGGHELQPDLAPDTMFVLPGTFSELTTVEDLRARFGDANVRVDSAAASDYWSPQVILFPEDPIHRAYVGFHDQETLSILASISVRDRDSRWRGKGGVHIGMSLSDLRRVNGKPFYYSGFDSLGRAWAHDQWSPALDDDDGQLGALDVGENDHMYFGVELGLRDPIASVPPDAYPHDEASISSDDPLFPRLGALVEVTEINSTTSLDDEWQ